MATKNATAAYAGFALIESNEARFSQGESGGSDRFTSQNVALSADLNNSTISGRIANWQNEDGTEFAGVVLTMPPTSFDNQGFSNNLSVSGFPGGTASRSFDGGYYGPDAEDAAGVISGTSRLGGDLI